MADRHILDDPSAIAALDPSGLFECVERFDVQCGLAMSFAEDMDLAPFRGDYDSVVLAGMGGSAIAGDYLSALFDLYGKCPFLVSRAYSIPRWVNERTLVICSSYSGNTREPLAAIEMAKRQNAEILAVTSGGKLAELAGMQTLRVSGGMAPRSALGFMFFRGVRSARRSDLLDVPPQ